ncbi:hypothetical protein ACFX1R_045926 [Malus domestica]
MWREPQQFQQDGYWLQYEEFYSRTMQPPQPLPQQFQSNSSMSIDNDKILDVLTSLTQGLQNQAKEMSELKNQLGEIAEFMGQIQEQSELSNSTIFNLTRDFEITEAITLGSSIEVGADPKMSKHSHNVDEQLLQEEEEVDKATTREEHPLP